MPLLVETNDVHALFDDPPCICTPFFLFLLRISLVVQLERRRNNNDIDEVQYITVSGFFRQTHARSTDPPDNFEPADDTNKYTELKEYVRSNFS